MTNISPAVGRQQTLPAATAMGPVSLTVKNLENQQRFYESVIGLKTLSSTPTSVTLGAGTRPLVVLNGDPNAPEAPTTAPGLYHIAILLPTRGDLGRWLVHVASLGYPLQGASDHFVSEAIYLGDPEGNGIEVYRDRERSEWNWDESSVRMVSDPLDLQGIVNEGQQSGTWQGAPEGTVMGHVHLKVGDTGEAVRFYRDVLGFSLTAQMPSAVFLAAGGYHHHIGANTWHSRGQAAAPAGSTGLGSITITVPDVADVEKKAEDLAAAGVEVVRSANGITVRDPWQNVVHIVAG